MGFLAAVALLLLVTGRPLSAPAVPGKVGGEIVAIGEAEMRVKPTLARVTFGLLTSGATASEAEAVNLASLAALRKALLESGQEEGLLEVSEPTLNAVTYQDSAGAVKVTGFQARVRVTASVRNMTRVQSLIDRALAAGATSLEEVTYAVENPESTRREVQSRALTNARERAELLAQSEGRKLGDLIRIEVLDEPPPVGGSGPGPQLFRARVRATFGF